MSGKILRSQNSAVGEFPGKADRDAPAPPKVICGQDVPAIGKSPNLPATVSPRAASGRAKMATKWQRNGIESRSAEEDEGLRCAEPG